MLDPGIFMCIEPYKLDKIYNEIQTTYCGFGLHNTIILCGS